MKKRIYADARGFSYIISMTTEQENFGFHFLKTAIMIFTTHHTHMGHIRILIVLQPFQQHHILGCKLGYWHHVLTIQKD